MKRRSRYVRDDVFDPILHGALFLFVFRGRIRLSLVFTLCVFLSVCLSVCVYVHRDFSAISEPILTKLAEWSYEDDAQMQIFQIFDI